MPKGYELARESGPVESVYASVGSPALSKDTGSHLGHCFLTIEASVAQ